MVDLVLSRNTHPISLPCVVLLAIKPGDFEKRKLLGGLKAGKPLVLDDVRISRLS